jgi:hypothetical protein
MVVLPALAAVISLSCALVIGRNALRRPRPDRIAWIVAFAMFAVAAGAEVIGSTAGWSVTLVRVYYLTGAVLVVGFLALGQLYLLAADRIGRVAPGIALLITAIAASTVWAAPIDSARLEGDGWDAIERTAGLKILAIGINSVGTLILIGGLIYSALRLREIEAMRNRTIGCLLIALGTVTVAMGGTLTRLGSDQYLYLAMSAGVALIFAGYLKARGREGAETDSGEARGREGAKAQRRGRWQSARLPAARIENHGIAFVESRLATLSNDELSRECAVWSVPTRDIEAFSRSEARRVWSLRNRLTPEGQTALDARPPGIRLQLAELYFDVMSADITSMELTAVAPIERASSGDD